MDEPCDICYKLPEDHKPGMHAYSRPLPRGYRDDVREALAERFPEMDEFDIEDFIERNYDSLPQNGVRVWFPSQY